MSFNDCCAFPCSAQGKAVLSTALERKYGPSPFGHFRVARGIFVQVICSRVQLCLSFEHSMRPLCRRVDRWIPLVITPPDQLNARIIRVHVSRSVVVLLFLCLDCCSW